MINAFAPEAHVSAFRARTHPAISNTTQVVELQRGANEKQEESYYYKCLRNDL